MSRQQAGGRREKMERREKVDEVALHVGEATYHTAEKETRDKKEKLKTRNRREVKTTKTN